MTVKKKKSDLLYDTLKNTILKHIEKMLIIYYGKSQDIKLYI